MVSNGGPQKAEITSVSVIREAEVPDVLNPPVHSPVAIVGEWGPAGDSAHVTTVTPQKPSRTKKSPIDTLPAGPDSFQGTLIRRDSVASIVITFGDEPDPSGSTPNTPRTPTSRSSTPGSSPRSVSPGSRPDSTTGSRPASRSGPPRPPTSLKISTSHDSQSRGSICCVTDSPADSK